MLTNRYIFQYSTVKPIPETIPNILSPISWTWTPPTFHITGPTGVNVIGIHLGRHQSASANQVRRIGTSRPVVLFAIRVVVVVIIVIGIGAQWTTRSAWSGN